jgi:uncharacterized protein YhbP (UPF0306 family)
MTRDDLRREILDFARAHHVLTLATAGVDGPWACALFYAADSDLNLYFISSPGTQHCRLLGANPRVAVAIHGMEHDWKRIRGLQIDAQASMVSEADRDRVEKLYLGRFPALEPLLSGAGSADERAVAGRYAFSTFYCIAPSRIRLVDNARGFGWREEIDWRPG